MNAIDLLAGGGKKTAKSLLYISLLLYAFASSIAFSFGRIRDPITRYQMRYEVATTPVEVYDTMGRTGAVEDIIGYLMFAIEKASYLGIQHPELAHANYIAMPGIVLVLFVTLFMDEIESTILWVKTHV